MAALGRKMGFDSLTVQPISGKGNQFFTAVPSETEQQRIKRVAREKEEFRHAEIARLSGEIANLQQQLVNLQV